MYEDRTYENLLKEKLSNVDEKFDIRQGSVIHTALAATSIEQAQVYAQLRWLHEQMHGDTAEREDLTKIAQDTRGMSPDEATCAVRKCVADVPLPIGLTLSLDVLGYEITKVIDDSGTGGKYAYEAACSEAGEVGNKYSGDAIPNEYVEGLTSVQITDVLIPGEEEEDTEVFRKRWKASFDSSAFGGNEADYKEKVKSINGVGSCKIARATNADREIQGGHVLIVIIASDYTAPSEVLVDTVQTIIDPVENAGEGKGLAPVDHTVHIQSVTGKVIDIATTLTLDSGYVFEDIQSYIEKAIDTYFLSLNKEWEEKESMVVRIAQIESAILNVTGVLDIGGTMLNGVEENITLDKYEIAVRGEISG